MSKVTKKDAAIFAAFQKEIDKRLQEDIDGVYVTASEGKFENGTYGEGLADTRKILFDIIQNKRY